MRLHLGLGNMFAISKFFLAKFDNLQDKIV